MSTAAVLQRHTNLRNSSLSRRAHHKKWTGIQKGRNKCASLCQTLGHHKILRGPAIKACWGSRQSSRIICCQAVQDVVPDKSVSAILLSGGVGKRMGASVPKQYIEIRGEAMATYSLRTFATMREIGEIVIVCDPSWRYIFEDFIERFKISTPVQWAKPGAERQDSTFNGLQAARGDAELVAVHDSARPLVRSADISRCLVDGWNVGAAVLGVKVKPTLKEVDEDLNVIRTVARARIWEVIRPNLLKEGYELVEREGLEVTDDVSIVEALGHKVKLTEGAYTNIKVTTPEDLSIAEVLLEEDAKEVSVAR